MPASNPTQHEHPPPTHDELTRSVTQAIRGYRAPTAQNVETMRRVVILFLANVRMEEVSPQSIGDLVQAVEEFRGAFLWRLEMAAIRHWQIQRRLQRLAESLQQPRHPVAWLVDIEGTRQAVEAAEQEREARRRRVAET